LGGRHLPARTVNDQAICLKLKKCLIVQRLPVPVLSNPLIGCGYRPRQWQLTISL